MDISVVMDNDPVVYNLVALRAYRLREHWLFRLPLHPVEPPRYCQHNQSNKAEALFYTLQEQVGFTEGQMQDLLVLRHLFFSRVGQLTSERIKLMQQMAENSQNLSEVGAWAERLRQNILEEHQMYLSNMTAIYLGVRSIAHSHKLLAPAATVLQCQL